MSVRFDASGDSLTRTVNLPTITAFSVMGWFQIVTDRNDFTQFIVFGDATGPDIYQIGTDSDGTTLNAYNGVDNLGSALTVGTWYHLALVCSGVGAGNLKAYLNGVLDITAAGASGPGAGKLWVGNSVFSEFLNGSAAAVKIYSASLTAAEVAQEMRQILPVRTANLNGWYPMHGTTALKADFSGNLNDWTDVSTSFSAESPPIPWKARSTREIIAPSTIAFDAATNSGYQAAASTYSWSHTCTGTERFLSVDIEVLSVPGTTVTGITYNGVALTLIGTQATVSGAGRVECWGLIAPASGSNTIAVTLSASVASAGTAVSYTGVDQTTATEGFAGAQATNVGAADATVSVTTVLLNSWVHAAVVSDDTAITAGQTTRNNVTGALGSGADEDTGPVNPAGATSMSYTNVGALATWAIAGYAIRPAQVTTPAAPVVVFPHIVVHSQAVQTASFY